MLSKNSSTTNDKNTVIVGDPNDHGDVIDAATMMELLATTMENARQIRDSKKNENDLLKEMNGKCFVGN